MTEITDFAAILLVIGAGVALAVLSTRLTAWIPIPSPAIFLVAAALVSDIWPSLYADVPVLTVERIAVVALIVILFNGGMDIGWRRFRGASRRSSRSASSGRSRPPGSSRSSPTTCSGSNG